ncbi:MAG: ABC transporter permease, partial [Deinococcus sp.]|nr:ABC transporter permease [Deinococcus sp.]
MNRARPDPILLLGAASGLLSLALPWVNFRANRLVLGEGVSLLGTVPAAWLLPALWLALGAFAWKSGPRTTPRAGAAAGGWAGTALFALT